jgi:HMGL-like/HAD-hyrolase-like
VAGAEAAAAFGDARVYLERYVSPARHVEVQFRALDFMSSTAMGVAVRTHREDPWERIRLTHAAMPDTPLQLIGTGFRFISWERAHPDVMRLVYERLVAAGISRFVLLDPMHDMDAVRRSARMIKRAGGTETIVALTYTISAVHDDAFYAGIAGQAAASPYIDRAYIKDPAGLLTPERARTLIPAVRARLGGKPLELHAHCTLGLSPLVSLTAPDLGVSVLQVACGALADGSSLPDAQRVVANLRELGHTVDVDDRLLSLVARYFDRLAAAESLPSGRPRPYDVAFTRHQLDAAGDLGRGTAAEVRHAGRGGGRDAGRVASAPALHPGGAAGAAAAAGARLPAGCVAAGGGEAGVPARAPAGCRWLARRRGTGWRRRADSCSTWTARWCSATVAATGCARCRARWRSPAGPRGRGGRTWCSPTGPTGRPPTTRGPCDPSGSTWRTRLAGWFPEFTMPALEAACHAVWGGAELFSCSQTPFFAVDGGRAMGTSRAISAMIRSLTGCRVRVVGKPSLDALRCAADRLAVPATQLAVVGDDPQLEVPMAHRGRALAIAVGTGLGDAASYDELPRSRRPHLRVRGVDELLEMLTTPAPGAEGPRRHGD